METGQRSVIILAILLAIWVCGCGMLSQLPKDLAGERYLHTQMTDSGTSVTARNSGMGEMLVAAKYKDSFVVGMFSKETLNNTQNNAFTLAGGLIGGGAGSATGTPGGTLIGAGAGAAIGKALSGNKATSQSQAAALAAKLATFNALVTKMNQPAPKPQSSAPAGPPTGTIYLPSDASTSGLLERAPPLPGN